MRLACLVQDSFARGIAESGRGGRQSTPISALHDSDTLFPEKAVDQAVHKYELIYALELLPASQQLPPTHYQAHQCCGSYRVRRLPVPGDLSSSSHIQRTDPTLLCHLWGESPSNCTQALP